MLVTQWSITCFFGISIFPGCFRVFVYAPHCSAFGAQKFRFSISSLCAVLKPGLKNQCYRYTRTRNISTWANTDRLNVINRHLRFKARRHADTRWRAFGRTWLLLIQSDQILIQPDQIWSDSDHQIWINWSNVFFPGIAKEASESAKKNEIKKNIK